MKTMHLRNDISAHRPSASLFIAWWLGVFAFTLLTWSGGMSDVAVSLHIATAVMAGGLVAWWRFPLREGLLVGGWRPAGPPLAGALVALAVVTLVFVREGVLAVLSGNSSVAGGAELLAGWLVASCILGAIGLLCGLIGGAAANVVAKYVKAHTGP